MRSSTPAPGGPISGPGLGPTSLVGRKAELAELSDPDGRLDSHRLVTVVGPGGVGKTSLAQEAARRVADRFPLGVRFVDLARVETPEAVAGSVAAQLGFASFEALVESPTDQAALVIVDNCEHVLDAAAAAITQLLERCELPTVLATSRSPLFVPGETVLALAPLAVPAIEDPDALQAPIVQLFLARSRDAGVVLSERDLHAVVPLCSRLDGLPLAIEIAAARARGTGVADLLARIDDGTEVLDRPRFRGSVRHRSVADVVRWSVDLLEPPEIELLERLAVRGGAFTRDTARRTSATPASFETAFDDLIHASLVSIDTSDDPARYRLLDIVRRFVLDRLRDRGDLESYYDRFVDEVLAVTSARLSESGMIWGPKSLRDAVAEFDDVAAALRWCTDHDREPSRALGLCAALLVIIEQGRADDIVALARRVFRRWPQAVAAGTPAAAEAVATLVNAENLTGNPGRGVQGARSALAAVPESSLAAVMLHQAIGDCSVALGDRRTAEVSYAEAAAVARRMGIVPVALEQELAHAQLRADAGDVQAALDAIDTVASEADAIGAVLTAVWASATRAWVTVRVRPSEAPALIDASLAACVEAGYVNGIAANLRSLAFCRLLDGDVDGATDALESLRDHVLTQGSLSNLRMLVDTAATIAHRAGHSTWEGLAATIDTLPPATLLAASGYALVPLPATSAGPLPARESLLAVRLLIDDRRAHPPARETADQPSIMHRTGDVWTVAFAGRQVTVRASKGLDTIAELVAAPTRELHCLDLMDAGVEQRSTGEVIDTAARRRYEERIRELQAQIDEAEADHDVARVERAQAEFDTLVDHLTTALGHVGKARRAGDTVERARSAVTHRVRSTIRRLDEVHEPLARHLERSISTGTYCSYRPELPTTWNVRP